MSRVLLLANRKTVNKCNNKITELRTKIEPYVIKHFIKERY
jgi:hypothetical protein